jgi:hypothetical protein
MFPPSVAVYLWYCRCQTFLPVYELVSSSARLGGRCGMVEPLYNYSSYPLSAWSPGPFYRITWWGGFRKDTGVLRCTGLRRVLLRWNNEESSHIARRNDSVYKTNKNSVALSRKANHTDWATATCRQNVVPTFVDRGVSRGQRGGSPAVVNPSFIDRSRYFSFK